MQDTFRRFVRTQVAISGFITVFLFVVYTVVVVTQVYFRYVLNDSLFWAEEFSRLAFFATIMMSLPVVCERNAHIVMDLLESSISETSPYRRLVRRINGVLVIAFFVLLCVYGFGFSEHSATMRTSTLGISMGHVYLLMPISSIVCIEVVVSQLLPGSNGGRGSRADDGMAGPGASHA